MKPYLINAAQEIDGFMRARKWRYCVVGGLAVGRWGEPRATKDVDLCLLTELGEEAEYIGPLVAGFTNRRDDAQAFAEVNRVVLIQDSAGTAIDVALGWTDFEREMIARATDFRLAPKLLVPTATAEDLIVTKAFAGRSRDWVDVEGIVARQRGKLNWLHIERELLTLCELTESPENVELLQRIRIKLDPG